MRISGDICTGTFAWGGCRGSSAPGSNPALKANGGRDEQERATADESKEAIPESLRHYCLH